MVKQCYLCNGVEFDKRADHVRDNPCLSVLECLSCGLVFLSSFEHIRDGFYENSGMHGENLPDIGAWLDETSRDDVRHFEYLKPALDNSRLLDFGCGAGGFLLKAKSAAQVAHGIEMEGRLKSHFQGQGLTVFQNFDEIPGEFIGKYDLITMFHVLEHIADPKASLTQLSKLLAPGGQLIIEVPSADDALLSLYRCKSFSDFTYWGCHLFLYTAKTLEMLFKQINLKISYIKQVQRYPLSNHFYWLTEGKPGGHKKWQFLDSGEINSAYEKQLASIGKCDTLLASVRR